MAGGTGSGRSGEWQETPGVGGGVDSPIESIHKPRNVLHLGTWLELG